MGPGCCLSPLHALGTHLLCLLHTRAGLGDSLEPVATSLLSLGLFPLPRAPYVPTAFPSGSLSPWCQCAGTGRCMLILAHPSHKAGHRNCKGQLETGTVSRWGYTGISGWCPCPWWHLHEAVLVWWVALPLPRCQARVVAVVVMVAAVTMRPAHTLLCSSRVSSWHRHCWRNLSLGHWHWLCPAPAMEPLGCFHRSTLEGFGLL